MQSLEKRFQGIVLGAYMNALTDLFLLAVPILLFAFVDSLLLRVNPVRLGASVSDAKAAASMH